ncbi:gamma-glutamyltransferase [Candidatus Pantoea floridensis]|uniref:Glutathione hydrolase proenzyme n=1 Tax=Candidatus Pantoea floridensis TaxID=1938870 RepID=A0A286BY18_9GAMM|nr:gamma-glutamyltransferase [Pantoea floridensis]PIF21523.1 gamma-glutamyltransferase 2 [Enterobacteriaceae bacterium JKS000233]SOD39034.1 gamma-glutamyltransferase 2. Threonine peptidase. MEROPS family T03 [Pantoea floridensis]
MAFNWENPYLTARTPVFARNVVSTSHPLAAQAGNRVLLEGGNAVDAAIATAATLTIVEPVSNGLGSDAFALVWADGQLHGLNASGPAPAAWDLNYFRQRYGDNASGHANRPERGWDSVTIPGAVAGWDALHRRFGKLPFSRLMQSALEIAERGVTVAPMVAKKWRAAVPILAEQPGFADAFMPNGRAPQVGEAFRFSAAAKTLGILADQGARAFYEGELAEKIVKWAQKTGGNLTLEDLRRYQPEWVTPVSQSYRGYEMHEIPPNGQGIAALIALGILENFDLASLRLDSVDSQHLQIEAMKLAFADVYRYVADPTSMEVTPEQMLDPTYLKQRAAQIDISRASLPVAGIPRSGGTVYLTTADESGMMVSFIQSNYMGFGSGVVVPEYGISLQNRGAGFSSDPKSANVLAPGKRPFHTIIPAFLTQNGQPQMSFGVMGGDMQPQGHVQTVVRMLDYQQQPQAACDAPRWKVNRDFTLDLENRFDTDVTQQLKDRGHQLKSIYDPYMDFGAGQFIWRLSESPDHGYVAASDSRRDGQALGF